MKLRIKTVVIVFIGFATLSLAVIGISNVSAVVPYITERVSLHHNGGEISYDAYNVVGSSYQISQDGRFVAYESGNVNHVSSDTSSNLMDIFVRDRKTGITVIANRKSDGSQMSGYVAGWEMSKNGRFIVWSTSQAIVPSDTGPYNDIFIRDLLNNTTEIVSTTSSGGQLNGNSNIPDISVDGRYVIFQSSATNSGLGDTTNKSDIYLKDRKTNSLSLLSKSTTGSGGNNDSMNARISCDGSYVSFFSSASNLVAGDTNAADDLFIVDRINGNVIKNATINGNTNSITSNTGISCNGSTIAFISNASNLVPNDTNSKTDLFSYNVAEGSFKRLNVDPSGNQISTGSIDQLSSGAVDFSGRYVVFTSTSGDIVSGDTNGVKDIFIRDTVDNITQIISKRNSSTQTTSASFLPSISLDGQSVIFGSDDSGLVAGDTNNMKDVFVSKSGI